MQMSLEKLLLLGGTGNVWKRYDDDDDYHAALVTAIDVDEEEEVVYILRTSSGCVVSLI